MKTLTDFALKEEYKRLESVGDKLAEIDSSIEWKPFRVILESMYSNKTVSGGRPETDVIVMFKMLVLQQWHGLSDRELEKQCIDRTSFRKFIGFPEYILDSSTYGYSERIIENGKEEEIWRQLQNRLDALGLKIKKGMSQDAIFIHSDQGHAKADKPRGDEAKTRRSIDGTWTKKGGKSHFGYKLHNI